MFSRGSSSSPDILQPPGDADYLISSPIKPFSGRQSFMMSPANFRILQTPRTGKGKRSRMSLSPTKSSHSIRFDDVLLPASPTMKLNRRQGSFSPDKAQPDGNTSPWRIRVTLEATQDDQENQGSPSRKRLKPSTITTKVPLNGEPDETPRRRRGRPRKSDARDATPNAGSPGNTPGPGGPSEQKRKRGRPRKSALQSEVVESGEQSQETEQEPVTVAVEPEQSWSPLNLAGDADSDDGVQDDFAPLPDPFHEGDQIDLPDLGIHPSPPRVAFEEHAYDTPNAEATTQFYLQNGGDELNSTPSKMPSPTLNSQILSPENSVHAGRTPRPPRTYPTPTSSSLVEDERLETNMSKISHSASNFKSSKVQVTDDPTNEHREFDSIMESEGFSMVSLDTLPSARQHGFNSGSKDGSKLVKGALKPFLERESNGVIKRKPRAEDHYEEEDVFAPKMNQNPVSSPEQHAGDSKPELYPRLPPSDLPAGAPEPSLGSPQRKPFLRLASIIRAGIALEGALVRASEEAVTEVSDQRDYVSYIEESKTRLELIFKSLDPNSQRVLRVGLGIGQELAKRRLLAKITSARQMEAERANSDNSAFEYRPLNLSGTLRQELDGTLDHETPSTEMKKRFQEWQREREAVSREIQMANSSQVIVINSDVSGGSSPKSVENPYYHIGRDPNWQRRQPPEQYHESDEEVLEEKEDEMRGDIDIDEEDDGYEDIWQQEARDPGNYSDHSSMDHGPQDEMRPTLEFSPRKEGSTPAQRQYGIGYSPEHWTDGQSKVPFLGRSRVKELREEEVDLSALLLAEDTPNRTRYYYGKSSPLSTANGHTLGRGPSSAVSLVRGGEDRHGFEPDLQSEEPVESSPRSFWEDETFQIDPTTRHESEMERWRPSLADDEQSNISDAIEGEGQPVQETLHSTPERQEHTSAENPASSWFQRITSLTPRWLKAPTGNSIEPPHPTGEGNFDDDGEEEEEEEEEEEPRPSNAELTHNEEDKEAHSTTKEGEEVGAGVTLRVTKPLNNKEQTMSLSPELVSQENTRVPSQGGQKSKESLGRSLPPASGFFSNEHYAFLRRLYRLAKTSPEHFPYYPGRGHSEIIGDWILTSDGTYGVPVTELQFAIINRFARELTAADLKSGGTGQLGWTEADLHRRLISIIIGEQIRDERKENQTAERSRASPLRNRRAGVASITARNWIRPQLS